MFPGIIAAVLHALRGDIRILDPRLHRVDRRPDGVDARPRIEIDPSDLRAQLDPERVNVGTAIDIRERLAALRAP